MGRIPATPVTGIEHTALVRYCVRMFNADKGTLHENGKADGDACAPTRTEVY